MKRRPAAPILAMLAFRRARVDRKVTPVIARDATARPDAAQAADRVERAAKGTRSWS